MSPAGIPTFEQFAAVRLVALRGYAQQLTADAELSGALVEEALIRTGLTWSRVIKDGDPDGYTRATIVALYLSRWARRRDGGSSGAGEATAPRSARLRRTIMVLCRVDGLPDDQIARLVGLSERRVRRIVAEMRSRSLPLAGQTQQAWATSK
ncbi:MAG: helix-turn-helix domain-containing protein [Sporichthyaceae bacterium]|nr:helix-turn-helix domain-containing protein [Sporichthyaceae bacterium]